MSLRRKAREYDILRPRYDETAFGGVEPVYLPAGAALCAVRETRPGAGLSKNYLRGLSGVAASLDEYTGVLYDGDVRAGDCLLAAGETDGYYVGSVVPAGRAARLLLERREAPTADGE